VSDDYGDKFAQHPIREGAKWYAGGIGLIIVIMITVAVIGAAVWGIGVAISDIQGRGEATKLKNSALNRTQAQAQFHSTFEEIRALDQKLTDAQANLDAFNNQHPNVGNGTPYDPLLQQQGNLQRDATGAQQQCRNAVADYNASTETYTLRDFRDSDLPYKIESSDPVFTSGSAQFSDFDCLPGK